MTQRAVGVDIGGTFTDFVMQADDGLHIHKRLTTPKDPAQSMLAGIREIAGLHLPDVVTHGSTVATNTILERRGARVALLVTAGLRDLLAIGRQQRPDVYALHPTVPAPIVGRQDCYEISERLNHRGDVLLALDETRLLAVIDTLATQHYDTIAVCLLFSFLNPAHEQTVRDVLVRQGVCSADQVILSSDVLPEFREYERASTTVLEAYVRPVMARYISHLREHLPAITRLLVMKSDGGVMNALETRHNAVQTALSGPAAGVIGAFQVASLAGYDQIITLDMGGTSTDVALCAGIVPMATRHEIDGLPLHIRMLGIETVGAGGGSLARTDDGGALRVGPQSAGAHPGPAAYGRGGTQPTVTDAHLVLGRVHPDYFLGGRMALDMAAAQSAMASLAATLHVSAEVAAQGILTVANSTIDRAIRRVSIAKGHDPRDFTLVAFGGAGGLHACEIADGLGIPRVLIPQHPGVLCALGLLLADVRVDLSRPIFVTADLQSIAQLRAYQVELISEGRKRLAEQNIPESQRRYEVALDMRYRGQAYELTIPFQGNMLERFQLAHTQAYGYALEDRPIEIVTMRLVATGLREKPVFAAQALGDGDASAAMIGVGLVERARLTPGMTLHGTALIVQMDATTYLPEGWQARVDAWHNLILTH